MPSRYHPVLVVLHWLMALMIIVALVAGTFVLDPVENRDPAKLLSFQMHMGLGLAIGLLVLVRLFVRARTAHPAPAATGIALADRLAPLAHWALYALVLAMVGSGIALSLASGLGNAVFFGGEMPANFDGIAARTGHGIVATLLMITIGLHILAALWHQVVRRDGLMARMGFGKR
ncbi:MAG: cytochrome b [Pararhodobacter sp.]|nr:cytochrome b [Pararhodobacter sp.]